MGRPHEKVGGHINVLSILNFGGPLSTFTPLPLLFGDEMMRLGVDICGLSEVRWNGQGHFTPLDGHTIVYSGRLTQGMSVVLPVKILLDS